MGKRQTASACYPCPRYDHDAEHSSKYLTAPRWEVSVLSAKGQSPKMTLGPVSLRPGHCLTATSSSSLGTDVSLTRECAPSITAVSQHEAPVSQGCRSGTQGVRHPSQSLTIRLTSSQEDSNFPFWKHTGPGLTFCSILYCEWLMFRSHL